MDKLYYKSRKFFYNQDAWGYTLEYLFEKQRPEYNWLVKINSFAIPHEKYKWFDFLVVIEIYDTSLTKEIQNILNMKITKFINVIASRFSFTYLNVYTTKNETNPKHKQTTARKYTILQQKKASIMLRFVWQKYKIWYSG